MTGASRGAPQPPPGFWHDGIYRSLKSFEILAWAPLRKKLPLGYLATIVTMLSKPLDYIGEFKAKSLFDRPEMKGIKTPPFWFGNNGDSALIGRLQTAHT